MTKLMVCSLLAMAVTASTALANGGEGDKKDEKGKKEEGLYQGGGGWSFKPGAGMTYDGGDQFGLSIVSHVQIRWQYLANENLPDNNSFLVRRARLALAGNVFDKDVTFRLMFDGVDAGGAAGGAVKDAWIQWAFSSSADGSIAVRAGQSKSGFGLEYTGTSTGLDFVERSIANNTFSNTRSRGAWVHGVHAENRLRWNAGLQNGDVSAGALGVTDVGEEVANSDNELTFVANASFDPMGDFFGGKLTKESWRQGDLEGTPELKGTIGGGIMIGNGRFGGADVESLNININTAWKVKQIALMGEVYLRSDDPNLAGTAQEDSSGFMVSGTYTMPKSGNSDMQWGFGARVSMVDTDNTINIVNGTAGLIAAGVGGVPAAGDVLEVTLGVNAFYHGHSAKTQFNYTFQEVDVNGGAAGDATNHILQVMVSLVF